MEAAAGALSPVLRKLGELLAREYNLEKRVKKGVQSLLTELEMMHAVLREVGKVPSDQLQEPVRIWAGKVRDLSCDMEDAVDDFLVRVGVGEGSGSKPTDMRIRINKFLKKTTTLFGKGKALHQICDAIKEAQDLAKELAEPRNKYDLDMFSSTNGATIDPRVLALQKDVGELVGLDRTLSLHNLQRRFRRLSLHNIKAKVQNHQFDSSSLSKVRTFAVFSPVTCDWLPSLSSFQFLRVLDLGNCGSHESSSGISLKYVGNLIHLRYLGLRSADIDELPMDIGKLHLLKIMDIRNTRIEELPASVVQLTNLICLYVDSTVRLPKGMGNLTSLEVLDRVRVSSSPHIVKELSHLTEVRTLEIDCANMDEDLVDVLIKSLGNLQKLQSLCIYDGGRLILDRMRESWVPPPNLRSFDSSSFSPWFLRLPKWVNSSSLPHISTLEIDVKELQGDDIQIIGMLPALRFLWLHACRMMGTLVVRADAFPYARCCMFRGFPTAPCLFPPGAMPRVQRLDFDVSARSIASGEVDCGLGHLPSLEHVEVHLERENSSYEEMKTARAWLRRAAEAHPKRPTILLPPFGITCLGNRCI